MIRWLLVGLLAIFAGSLAAIAVLRDNGYVLIGFGEWTIEASLALIILLDLILFIVLYLVIRFFVRLWQAPGNIRQWNHQRQQRLAQKSLTRGLLEMAEGDWKNAEKRLLRHAANAETPLLNYLAAARAAQLQGAHDRRDNYLQLAHESMPSADVAVGLTQAELQLAHQQLEQALATLKHLKSIAPRHVYVLKLLAELYQQLDDWQQMQQLLPELKKQRACSNEELERIELRVHLYALSSAAGRDLRELEAAWKKIPRRLRFRRPLVIDYARHLVSLQSQDQAVRVIDQCLTRHADDSWDDDILLTYANINASDPVKQLSVAEKWLDIKPGSATLLLILGRLCLKSQLWGKARSYLESSISLQPSIAAHHELGNLLEKLGESEQARNHYRQGLDLKQEFQPVALPANLKLKARQQEDNDSLPIPTDSNPPPANLLADN